MKPAHFSDDNPFSEAGFKTLKYQLDYRGFFARLGTPVDG
jgi:hypothetical protein